MHALNPRCVERRRHEFIRARRKVADDLTRDTGIVDRDRCWIAPRRRTPVDSIAREIGQHAAILILCRRGPVECHRASSDSVHGYRECCKARAGTAIRDRDSNIVVCIHISVRRRAVEATVRGIEIRPARQASDRKGERVSVWIIGRWRKGVVIVDVSLRIRSTGNRRRRVAGRDRDRKGLQICGVLTVADTDHDIAVRTGVAC